MNCAPGKNGSFTCYTKEQLIKMAKSINEHNNNKKIKVTNRTKKELWEDIKTQFSKECTYEWCWLDSPVIKKINDRDLHHFTFLPKRPASWKSNRNVWLTTTDIEKVMAQYEKLYKDFMFFGPVPVDCPGEFYCELSNLDIKKMNKNGINKIGVVFNLDKHNEPGSHWVALFTDKNKKLIQYYDSVSSAPPRLIKNFMKELQAKYLEEGTKMKIETNRNKHQYGGSECGVYSMNFIIECLKGKTMKDFQNKKISDFSVNILRDYLYRPYFEKEI